MNAYYYTPRYRPPVFCTLPEGWELVEAGRRFVPPNRPDLKVGITTFGVVRYRRPLSLAELYLYELDPAPEVPQ